MWQYVRRRKTNRSYLCEHKRPYLCKNKSSKQINLFSFLPQTLKGSGTRKTFLWNFNKHSPKEQFWLQLQGSGAARAFFTAYFIKLLTFKDNIWYCIHYTVPVTFYITVSWLPISQKITHSYYNLLICIIFSLETILAPRHWKKTDERHDHSV